MFGMEGFHISASGSIQGHHCPLVLPAGASNLDIYNYLLFFKELNISGKSRFVLGRLGN